MKRNNPPEFAKTLRTLDFYQKYEKMKFQNVEKKQKFKHRHDYLLFSVAQLSALRAEQLNTLFIQPLILFHDHEGQIAWTAQPHRQSPVKW
jgi:hypothetical protein